MNLSSADDARRFLSLLAKPNDVFELRALSRVKGQQHIDSGYFDDIDALVRAAVSASGKHDGIYITINPVDPALLFRAPKNSIHRGSVTTSDKDVRIRRSILVDVDPVRPAGISSSDAEHDAAIARAKEIRTFLNKQGWPAPILADSGNGAHLIYAVELPVKDDGLVQRVLKALSDKFTTPELKVDEKVFNAARISKIYGTLTRKGINAPERPHRLAKLLEAPTELYPVPVDMLEQVAGPKQQKASNGSTNGTHHTFDLEAWIATYLPDAKEREWPSGRKWLLKECPFNPQHDRSEAYVCQQHDGVIAAGCQHESCFKSWRELRERFEPGVYERKHDTHERKQQAADAHETRERSAQGNPEPQPSRKWKRGPELADELWDQRNEPWVSLKAASEEEIIRVRVGGIVVVMGGSGSGKSSLVSNMLIRHALEVGPAIALSIELPAVELAARIVGIRCDASWEDSLTGRVRREWVVDALNLPRLYVLERKAATPMAFVECVQQVRKDYPDQPILAAVDYAQLMHSKEREVRMRVNDAFEQLDDVARQTRVAMIAVSQMGRAGAKAAREGERIGADAADLGAESAAIERFASATLTIGQKSEPFEDGSQVVEVSIGKMRMGQGDRVLPMRYWGRAGIWRVDGDAQTATAVRESRDADKQATKASEIRTMLVGAAHRSLEPLSRDKLQEMVSKGSKKERLAAIAELISRDELVEVDRYAPRSRAYMVWTPDRVNATPGLRTVKAKQAEESDDDDLS